jgi:hypothetical protein
VICLTEALIYAPPADSNHLVLGLGPRGLGFLDLSSLCLFGGAFEVEFQEAFEDLFVGDVGGLACC